MAFRFALFCLIETSEIFKKKKQKTKSPHPQAADALESGLQMTVEFVFST